MNYFASIFVEIQTTLSALCKVYMIFPQCGKFKSYFPQCGKYHKVVSTLWKLSAFFPQNYFNFLTVTIHIIDHLEHFFHISSIEPKDLRGLPQILPQSAKFLPRACSRRSRNIPSLFKFCPKFSFLIFRKSQEVSIQEAKLLRSNN